MLVHLEEVHNIILFWYNFPSKTGKANLKQNISENYGPSLKFIAIIVLLALLQTVLLTLSFHVMIIELNCM